MQAWMSWILTFCRVWHNAFSHFLTLFSSFASYPCFTSQTHSTRLSKIELRAELLQSFHMSTKYLAYFTASSSPFIYILGIFSPYLLVAKCFSIPSFFYDFLYFWCKILILVIKICRLTMQKPLDFKLEV